MTDTVSETTHPGAKTPPSSISADKPPPYFIPETVPVPGNSYFILERDSQRAITLQSECKLALQAIQTAGKNADKVWLCCESSGYIGFKNEACGVYIGHDGRENMQARAVKLDNWELLHYKRLADGGYQILSPFYAHSLKVVIIADGGRRLIRGDHGSTVWEFLRV